MFTFLINHALKFKYQPGHLKVKPCVTNHEQQVGKACEKCIPLNEGCLFTILLQSIQEENNVTKGLVKNNEGNCKKMQKNGGWG
jgi:hypothetical protein